ncbi:hypothetical protein ACH5RR_038070 [Cinchona calisaya]|uniref:Transcription factor CBF/NF-Y/archaeal histone domain-containing protein n=1 Tax=Cinchona calisaya TaxID=153742 RepID=A0ABD2YAB9_9GENT
MADSDNESGGNNRDGSNLREQDRFLPIANVSRIMKKALPANAKISKDAKETVQECVSEFISFITGEASDKCQREKRKTINGDDLLWAMTTLGFEDYVEPLKIYLQRFRDLEGEKSAMAGRLERDGGAGAAGGGGGNNNNGSAVNMGNSGGSYVGEGGSGGMYHGASGLMIGTAHQQHHQEHVYGSGVYNQMPGGGSGKVGSGYIGSGSSATGRPR